ncbi:MAG: hypothetical protein U9N81_05715, partial [Bacillota bacterium]|nr:hypothetical protein [Bacillota bacterium]
MKNIRRNGWYINMILIYMLVLIFTVIPVAYASSETSILEQSYPVDYQTGVEINPTFLLTF